MKCPVPDVVRRSVDFRKWFTSKDKWKYEPTGLENSSHLSLRKKITKTTLDLNESLYLSLRNYPYKVHFWILMRSVLCQADWYHITPHWLTVSTLMLLKTEFQVLFTFIPPAIHYIYNSFWIKKQESEQVQLTFILPSILSEIKHVNEIEQWTFNITRENPISDLLYYRNLQGDLEETISGNVIIDFLPLGGGNIRSSSNTIRYFVLSALRSGD